MFKLHKILVAALCGAALLFAQDAFAIIGRPATPMSYAGAARRSVRPGGYGGYAGAPAVRTAAAVGAAAAVGTAAVVTAGAVTAAAVASLPAGCNVGVPCAGVTYQPAFEGDQLVYVPE